MPNGKHIVVVQDMFTRFPAAKIVHSTSAKDVLPSLDEIYTSYGYPSIHITDNGSPFNSESFKNYSLKNGIQHCKAYLYHPQANPAERLMKPIGKTMKAVFMEKKINNKLLVDF